MYSKNVQSKTVMILNRDTLITVCGIDIQCDNRHWIFRPPCSCTFTLVVAAFLHDIIPNRALAKPLQEDRTIHLIH